MSLWFFIWVACFGIVIPLHMKSVEHIRLHQKYGEEKGKKIGKIYGTISGTLEFIILMGLWFSPQPMFIIPILSNLGITIVIYSVSLLNLIVGLPLIGIGAWFGIAGVRATGLELAETHSCPTKILVTGVYSIVRHPQYVGWILAHIGISMLLSVWYSMLFTPVLLIVIYFISRKEEAELLKEFGQEYVEYQKEVPMLIPRWR